MEKQKRKRRIKEIRINKRIIIRNILIITIVVLLIFIIAKCIIPKKETKGNTNITEVAKVSKTNKIVNNIEKNQLDWKLILVNSSNKLPANYEIKLSSIDKYRKFDSRAIKYLEDMREDGVRNIWVQSSYRSVEEQTKVYNNKIESYKEQGKTRERSRITYSKNY